MRKKITSLVLVASLSTTLFACGNNGDDTTTRTLKLHSNSYNLLSADDRAFANAKGWNITK